MVGLQKSALREKKNGKKNGRFRFRALHGLVVLSIRRYGGKIFLGGKWSFCRFSVTFSHFRSGRFCFRRFEWFLFGVLSLLQIFYLHTCIHVHIKRIELWLRRFCMLFPPSWCPAIPSALWLVTPAKTIVIARMIISL